MKQLLILLAGVCIFVCVAMENPHKQRDWNAYALQFMMDTRQTLKNPQKCMEENKKGQPQKHEWVVELEKKLIIIRSQYALDQKNAQLITETIDEIYEHYWQPLSAVLSDERYVPDDVGEYALLCNLIDQLSSTCRRGAEIVLEVNPDLREKLKTIS